MHRIVIEISPSAEVRITVKGVQGPGCRELTKALERALGATTKSVATAEFHQRGPQTHAQR